MTDEDWESGFAKSVSVFLNGDGIREPDVRGERVTDASFFLLFNAYEEPLDFTVPEIGAGESWQVVVDTEQPLHDEVDPRSVKSGDQLTVAARTILVLRKTF